jgi:hypothetical protein
VSRRRYGAGGRRCPGEARQGSSTHGPEARHLRRSSRLSRRTSLASLHPCAAPPYSFLHDHPYSFLHDHPERGAGPRHGQPPPARGSGDPAPSRPSAAEELPLCHPSPRWPSSLRGQWLRTVAAHSPLLRWRGDPDGGGGAPRRLPSTVSGR